MSTVALNESTFAQTVKGGGIVFIDFWAAWCGPCVRFAPVFESVAEANPDIVFAKVDTEAEQGLAGAFNITSIPTLMAVRDGIIVFSQAGALPDSGLNNLVQAVRDLDMDAIRAEVAQSK